ncbi:hypothetical protein EON65_26195 [archaeon]|nr:MAG: hypothetical protein EON65_26195 [archaeon]
MQLSSFVFLRAGGVQLTEGMRTMEKLNKQDDCALRRIAPTADLAYSVVGVLHDVDKETLSPEEASQLTKPGDVPQALLRSNVAGFVSILQIDVENDRLTLLSPCPGALPSNYLLVGSVKWIEN